MGNQENLPNVVILEDEEQNTTTENRTSTFNEKNYLDVKLGDNETKKEIRIRLLPMDLKSGNPFAKIMVHNIEVPAELVKQGSKHYKSFICLRKTDDIDHNKYGHKCPLCEMSWNAHVLEEKETDPAKKEEYNKTMKSYYAKPAVVVRCIERGKENEGVKFWKFNVRLDETDPYNQIKRLVKSRQEGGENILDIHNGKDLQITITKGNAAPTIIDYGPSCPLSADEEQMKKWIFDEKKWQNVFTCKPYEYLKLISEMRIPWFDKEKGIWVDKEEFNKDGKTAEAAEIDKKIDEAATKIATSQPVQAEKSIVDDITIGDDGDDLPF